MGDTLFTSDYIFSNFGKLEQTYSITSNPYMNYPEFDSCGDRTTGVTNMMIVNGDTVKGSIVWEQLVSSLDIGTDYEFSFWSCSIKELRPAVLLVIINNDTLRPYPVYVSDSSCYWVKTTYVWNSGTTDTARIRIYDEATNFFGNDFALDDISMMQYCRLQVCAGQSLNTCKNIPITLPGKAEDGQEPYSYKWSPAGVLDNPNIQNPLAVISQTTKFYLEVTDARNCVSYDSLDVIVYDEPDNTITTSHQMPACPCESVILIAPPGMKYLWSNLETSRQINVSQPGIYTVEIEDAFGCKSLGSFELTHEVLTLDMYIDSLSYSTGKEIAVEIKTNGTASLQGCGYTDFTAKIRYNATLLVPRGTTPFGIITDGFETITITGKIDELQSNPLRFFTVWGNAACTDITIEELSFDCDSISTDLSNGLLCLDDLCEAAGTRLFDSRDTPTLNIIYSDQVLHADIWIAQDGFGSITLYNYTGEQLSIIADDFSKIGRYSYDMPVNFLSPGIYWAILRSAGFMVSKPFIVD